MLTCYSYFCSFQVNFLWQFYKLLKGIHQFFLDILCFLHYKLINWTKNRTPTSKFDSMIRSFHNIILQLTTVNIMILPGNPKCCINVSIVCFPLFSFIFVNHGPGGHWASHVATMSECVDLVGARQSDLHPSTKTNYRSINRTSKKNYEIVLPSIINFCKYSTR